VRWQRADEAWAPLGPTRPHSASLGLTPPGRTWPTLRFDEPLLVPILPARSGPSTPVSLMRMRFSRFNCASRILSLSVLLASLLGIAGCKVDQQAEVNAWREVIDPENTQIEYVRGQPLGLEMAFALANHNNEVLGLRGEEYLQALIAKDRAAAA